MARFYFLVKRKGSKKLLGLLPTRKGISRKSLLKQAKFQIKKAYSYKLVNSTQLKRGVPSKMIRNALRVGGFFLRKKIFRKRKF